MISRVHPVANWVRLPPYEQRVALERVMRFRDMDPNPRASGVPLPQSNSFGRTNCRR